MDASPNETKPPAALRDVPHILVVDDEERIRLGCQAVLSKEGFQVTLADSGVAALEHLEQGHFDVALLDLMMPTLSGFEILARVRETHPDLVVIVITGYATLEHSVEAMKKGAFDFIPKPFTPDQLRVVVGKALAHTRALQDITTERSRVRVLINRLSDGVLATDTDKQVALCNPAFQRLLGYEGPSPLGCPLEELEAPSPLTALLDRALAMEPPEFAELTEELEMSGDAEGPSRVLAARCVPFRDRPDRNIGTITVLRDVTEARRLEQQKSDFVSMVAHEIRSPMSAVLMQLNVLRDGLAGDLTDKQREIMLRASARIQSLVDLASELLELSRIESGLIAQDRELLDPGPVIRDQVELHRHLAEAKAIRLAAEVPERLPSILFNRQSLEEVLSNLLTNAIKYTPEQGDVRLGVGPHRGRLRIEIQDSGFGIAPEDQAQIFRRFYRVKNAQTRMITGTGLGLPIVKQILEAHNARIRLESEEGRGSTFYVTIPAASA